MADNSIYENMVVRVCCQHGKPCAKGQMERHLEQEKTPSDAAPDAVQQPTEETTYENLDPAKPKAAAKPPARVKCAAVDDAPVIEKLPMVGENESLDSSNTTIFENTPKKKRDRAARVYLGMVEWKAAEKQLRGRVALYHQADDPQKQLFLLTKKKHGLRHYRVIQRNLDSGTVFMAEDGAAGPLECGTLDSLVKFYKSKAYRRK